MTKILVVEDSPVDRMLVGGLLGKEQDWNIEFANDGQEAIDLFGSSETMPDVIVTDLQMPRVDGLALVTMVRETHPTIPVILITSQGSEQIAIKALRAGATSFTPKSMMRSDLIRTIKQVLEMSKRMKYTHDLETLPAPKQVAFVLENDCSLILSLIHI